MLLSVYCMSIINMVQSVLFKNEGDKINERYFEVCTRV
jgi:hypothetical protein